MHTRSAHETDCAEAANRVVSNGYALSEHLRLFTHAGQRFGLCFSHDKKPSFLYLNPLMEDALLALADGENRVTAGSEALADLPLSLCEGLRSLGVLQRKRPPSSDAKPAPPRLASMYIFPSNDCNLRCAYCYASAGDTRARRISMDTVDAAFRHFFRSLPDRTRGVRLIFHGGGEPTEAFDVLQKSWASFKLSGAWVGAESSCLLTSNGMFSRRVCDWIVTENISIGISLDGPASIQNALRPQKTGAPSYERVAHNVRSLVSRNVSVGLQTTITSSTTKFMHEIVEHAHALGAAQLKMEPCGASGRASGQHELIPDADTFASSFIEAVEFGFKLGIPVTSSHLQIDRAGSGYYCGALTPALASTPEGFLTCCPEVSSVDDPRADPFIYGRLTANGDALFFPNRRELLRKRHYSNLEGCRDCHLGLLCSGGCPARSAASEDGFMNRHRYSCLITRQVTDEAIARIAGGRWAASQEGLSRVVEYGSVGSSSVSGPWIRACHFPLHGRHAVEH